MIKITDDNFEKYFFDVRKHKPEKGQVIACYTSMAEFVDGYEKRHIISLLQGAECPEAIVQVMKKLNHASEEDAYRVPKLMAKDLLKGMTYEEVATKPYKFKMELFYYTDVKHIPADNPHWSCISIINLDEFDDGLKITSKIIDDEL